LAKRESAVKKHQNDFLRMIHHNIGEIEYQVISRKTQKPTI